MSDFAEKLAAEWVEHEFPDGTVIPQDVDAARFFVNAIAGRIKNRKWPWMAHPYNVVSWLRSQVSP